MSLYIQKLLLLFVLTLLSAHNVISLGRTQVTILNHLDSKSDLTVHCKSADDDLGLRHLHFEESFNWSFGINFIGQTQYYCSFQWNNGKLYWYDIYKAHRDSRECRNCIWWIYESGPCRLDNMTADCYPWND